MPSSISSSEARMGEIQREIPQRAWLSMAVIALVLNALSVAAWESYVRSQGYEPDYDDTTGLWVPLRAHAREVKREQLVFVGASRTLFNTDLSVFQAALGGPQPIQLSTVGSNPMIIFNHVAADPTFAGTLVVGVVPGLFAVSLDLSVPPNSNPQHYVKSYENWGPAQAWEQPLSLWLQERFAFIQQEDLSLKQLSRRLDLPNRPEAYAPPDLPPHFSRIERNRQARMLVRAERDPAFMQRIQRIWLRLFSPPPKPPIFSDEQWAKMAADAWNATLAKAKVNVAAIRARGGRVIFVRDPSSGALLELEQKSHPRQRFWDRILQETGAPGIHYADYPELRDFTCPEWSHLSAGDAVEYSKRLVTIMKREGML